MSIPQRHRKTVMERSNGRCECRMRSCDHKPYGSGLGLLTIRYRCEAHGTQIHHKNRQLDPPALHYPSNLLLLCADCHKNTRTYGRPL